MPGVVRIVLRVAFLNDLVAHLEERFLEFRDALAGLDFDVDRAITEFVPEIGIRNEPARLHAVGRRTFCRTSPFGETRR